MGSGLLQGMSSVSNIGLLYLHVLFSKIIFTDEHPFYNFCSENAIARGKNLTFGNKKNFRDDRASLPVACRCTYRLLSSVHKDNQLTGTGGITQIYWR